MKSLRALFAVLISLSLTLLSPGLGSYAAAAGMIGSASRAASSSVGFGGAAGAAIHGPVGRALSVSPVQLNLSLKGLSLGVNTPRLNLQAPSSISAAVSAEASKSLETNVAATGETISFDSPMLSVDKNAPATAMELIAEPEAVSMGAAELARMSPANARSLGGIWMDRVLGRRAHASNTAVVPAARSFGLSRSGLSASQAKKAKTKGKSRGKSDEEMPDYGRSDNVLGPDDFSNTDELGNERRRQTPGPDDVYDEYDGRGGSGNSVLFGLAGLGLSPFVAAALPGLSIGTAVAGFLAIVLPALVLHEMSHAWLADKLGDPNPRLEGRLSWRPRNLWNHVNKPLEFNLFGRRMSVPLGWSIVMPVGMIVVSMLTLGLPIFFGGARPVEPTPRNLASPAKGRSAIKGMAMTAMTGPLTHFALAALLGLAHTGLMAAGLATALLPALAVGVWLNVLFGIFNALPVFPLDGHHVMRWLVAEVLGKPGLARSMYGDPVSGTISRSARAWNMYALMGTFIVGFGLVLLPLTNLLTDLFLTGSSLLAASGIQTAAAVLPFAGAVGILAGHLRGQGKNKEDGGRIGLNPPAGADPNAVSMIPSEEMPESKLFIVRFPESASEKVIESDVHLSLVDLRGRHGIQRLAAARDSISVELNGVKDGMMGLLAAHNAQPIATYKRINAATIQVPEGREASLRSALEAQGFLTYDNAERRIVKPIEDDTEIGDEFKHQDAEIGGAVTMEETLRISTADQVQEEARKRWGTPGTGWRRSLLAALLSALHVVVPQPAIGVIDTGVEKDHRLIQPYLKAARDVRPDGDGADDNGHGSWVTSMVANYARWSKNITHYKAFSSGGATLDDVLQGLTMAANDGNIIVSNSWGSGSGDPKSPDSLLVEKMAQDEGRIMVFAAGNSGSWGRKNTIGSPAIIHARAPNGAPRVIAVAATKRDKKRASFSSRGPGSPATSRSDEYKDYPRKPDAAEQGNNTEGAWIGGRLRAISGTSMSAPKFAGTLGLLAMLFGVTKVGEELDRIVKAVFDTLANEYNQDEIDIGDGFNAVWAAYQALTVQGFAPVKRGRLQRFLVWLLDPGFARSGPPNPRPEAPPRPGSDSEGK